MTLLSGVPAILASAFGMAAPEYRATTADAWATLPGAHWGKPTPSLDPDPDRMEESIDTMLQMTVDQASPRLETGYQVRIGGESGDVYAVEIAEDNSHHGVMVYMLRRSPLIRRTADRGALR